MAAQAFADYPRFSRWMPRVVAVYSRPMKSCLGLLFTLLVFTLVVGGGALIWYLSSTAEFSRKGITPDAASALPPKAKPVPPATAPQKEPARR